MMKKSEGANNVAKKTKNKQRKYVINILFVLVMAVLVGWLTLRDDYSAVFASISKADWRFIVIIIAVMFLYYAIDGLIIYIFARLYTTRYKWHRGLAVSFIGQFHESVSPTKNGKFAQASTLRKQKLKVSSAASIIIMYSILSQIVLIGFGLFAMIFHFDFLVASAEPIRVFGTELPVWVFALIGFIFNAVVIMMLFFMSYSKKLHDFIINSIVKIGTKLKIIKYPEKRRAKMKVTTENFRIELKRLQSNIPVTILVVVLLVLRYFSFYSIPYLVGSALTGQPMVNFAGNSVFFNSLAMNAFLEMITKLIPIPGNAGIAEYMFTRVYSDIFVVSATASAAENLALLKSGQLLWRFVTFYFGLIVGALVTAFYKSRLETETDYVFESKSFGEIQMETLEERQASMDTMVVARSLTKREVNDRLRSKRRATRRKNRQKKDND